MRKLIGISCQFCGEFHVPKQGNLRRELRATVTRRFQPVSRSPWWQPNPRELLRFAAGGVVFVVAMVLIVVSFFGYQNWRSRRAWVAFQSELRQQGKTLELRSLLPEAAPDDLNFARAPAFQGPLNRLGRNPPDSFAQLLERLNYLVTESGFSGPRSPGSSCDRSG